MHILHSTMHQMQLCIILIRNIYAVHKCLLSLLSNTDLHSSQYNKNDVIEDRKEGGGISKLC